MGKRQISFTKKDQDKHTAQTWLQ